LPVAVFAFGPLNKKYPCFNKVVWQLVVCVFVVAMAGFDDPSLKDLNERLQKMKRGPHYEEAKATTPEELHDRLKKLKDIETGIPDDKLLERFQKIAVEDGTGKDQEKGKEEEFNQADLVTQQYLEQLQLESKVKSDEEEDDDFELFLAEAGVSDKIIDRMMQCPIQEDGAVNNETNIVRLESDLTNSDSFAETFQSTFNLSSSHETELSQLMNQANDELRLLPSSNIKYSFPSESQQTAGAESDLQDMFDDSDEIQRLVTEAQELAALDRKYQAIESTSASQPRQTTKPSEGARLKSSQASLTHFEPNDYYYRLQAQNISQDVEREKEKKSRRNRRGRAGSSSDSDSTIESDDSY
jgi:hypothetical protein